MFYALMVGLLSLGAESAAEASARAFVGWQFVEYIMDDDRRFGFKRTFVSNMGDFARPLKTVFVLALLLTFALVQGITEAAAPQNERWVYVFAVVLLTALAHVFVSDIFGKDECGRTGLGFF